MTSTHKLEENLQYTFTNKKLLEEALTHPSKKVENRNLKTYQRLEFLGDKVLNFIIAHELFLRFPHETEGEISRRHAHLVSGSTCVQVAERLDLLPYIQCSDAQKNSLTFNAAKIYEDALEAIIGAIFLDSNTTTTKQLVISYWGKLITNGNPPKDCKSALQEHYQKHYQIIPEYQTVQYGEGFIASLKYNKQTFTAEASTKKEAEKLVAQKILEVIASAQEMATQQA